MDRDTFLYRMEWWEIVAVIRGYHKRGRDLMMMMRWQSFVSCKAWGAKMESPTDLLRFDWEKEPKEALPSDEEVEKMRELLRMENEKLRI